MVYNIYVISWMDVAQKTVCVYQTTTASWSTQGNGCWS